jgi:hypothetical protein
MKLYRIITENKNRDWLELHISKSFDGFSIIEQTGYWKNERESSLCIEIVTNFDVCVLQRLCQEICRYNEQEAILLQELDCKAWLVK